MTVEARQEYRGIEGVHGVEPVGAVLTIGQKGPRGNPVDNDRFFLVVPTMGADGRREAHPEFAKFNDMQPERRQIVHGNLVHVEEADAWEYHLKAQVLPKPWQAHPDKRPSCIGDGERATRYHGKTGPDDFREMDCPNDLCEFRQGTGAKPCKPWGRLYFRIRWPYYEAWPTPLVKWATGSWNSVRSVLGFFEHVRLQAEGLGLESYSLYGLPFSLTLSRKTKPSAKTSFPVVSMSPECDLIGFFLQQRTQIQELNGSTKRLLVSGARSEEEQAHEEVTADHATITPGHVRKPAAKVEEEVVQEPEPEGEVIGAEADPGLDERYERLVAQTRGLGLSDLDLQDAIMGVAGNFPDLDPGQDAEVIAELQRRASKNKCK